MNSAHAQLFLDDTWIADSAFVTRNWHQPRKFPDPVLVSEHPWERGCPVMYGTVLYQEGRFRMWYDAWSNNPPPRVVCYAESTDGVIWAKPRVQVCDYQGSRDNNIVIDSVSPDGFIDDITIIDDAEDSRWPLKALFYDNVGRKEPRGIYAARSKDGIHWDRSLGRVLSWDDRFNAVSSRVGGKYIIFGRASAPNARDKGRVVWRSESSDLIRWNDPELVLSRDDEDPPALEYYSGMAFPYEGIMMGAIERMHMSPDKLDTEIIWSYDLGRTWKRARSRPQFIPWGLPQSFDDTWINLPTNGPIRHNNSLWFFYSGRSGAHGAVYPMNHGGIGLATLRIDGFASLRADEREGWILTPPLPWPGGEIQVNIDPRNNLLAHPQFCQGSVQVEIQDAENHPLPGFSKADSIPLGINTICGAPAWTPGKKTAELAGRTIRVCFYLRHAHLYSFRSVQHD